MDSWTLALVILSAAVSAGLAVLGGYVSTNNRAHVVLFFVLGALGIAVAVAQGIRNGKEQARSAQDMNLLMTFVAAERHCDVEWVYADGRKVGVTCKLSGTAAGHGGAHGTLTVTQPSTPPESAPHPAPTKGGPP